MRVSLVLPLGLLGLAGCVIDTPAPARTTTYVTPAPAPTYVAPPPTYAPPVATYVEPAPTTTTVIRTP